VTAMGYAWQKRWAYDRASGRPRTADAAPARERIAGLRAAGWSYGAIAKAAGTDRTTVHSIGHGQRAARVGTIARILACDPAALHLPAAGETFVLKTGTVRRIQALQAAGWTHAHLAARSGVRTSLVLSQPGRWVTAALAAKVAAAYDELAMTGGPSARTRSRAAAKGWPPPLAWDDDTIDDPAAEPAAAGPASARRRAAEVAEDAEWLARTGTVDGEDAAARLGLTVWAAEAALRRAGRPDLANALGLTAASRTQGRTA
jgi:hypothetical protein